MKVELREVEYVALLARLKLSEEEKKVFTSQLNAILDYMEKLNELDTSTVDPTFHVVPHHNTMREDEVKGSLPQDASLENAPDTAQGCFRVPKII
jgi:aspartyl-tRNA(Asn)/glutamyl-tRNA(Gln) amidotransferase subunit C